MSVINNVLKDLESRKSRFTPIEISTPAAPSSRAHRRFNTPAILVLLLLSLAAGGWWWLQTQPGFAPQLLGTPAKTPAATVLAPAPRIVPEQTGINANAVVVEPIQSATAASPGDPLPASAPPAAAAMPRPGAVTERMLGNQLIGLQLRESETEMRMEFVLRERAVAYLKERGENHFVYHLRDLESRIVAPVIRDNRWLRDLELQTTADGLNIVFDTAADILVETRQESIDGEPVWAINLRQAEAAPRAASAPQAIAQPRAEISAADPQADAASPVEQTAAAAAEESPAQTAAAALPVKLEIKTSDPSAKTANQLEYAVELMQSGRFTDAEGLLRDMLGGSEDYRARAHLLALYSRQQQQQRFDRLVRASVAAYPDDALFKTEYARALFQRGSYRGVIELLGLESERDARQQALLAASHQRLDQHDEAVRHYQQALAQDAANAKNWIGLGISQEHTAALADALRSYQQAGKLGSLDQGLRAFVEQRSKALSKVLN